MPRETPQQLWTERLAGRSALPSLLVQLFSAKEMRYLLGSYLGVSRQGNGKGSGKKKKKKK